MTDTNRAAHPLERTACLHLGEALPNQTGPCGQKVRKCDEFGTCTLLRYAKAIHACEGCERYET
jgi:hypothetical protein